jgi:Reverse transcriptase (RNA-dependent DNA polymerase)
MPLAQRRDHYPQKTNLGGQGSQDGRSLAENPDSYRPISLLSLWSKLFEKIILSRLDKFILDNIIPNEQFGFRKKHSTIQQLIRLSDRISDGFNKNKSSATFFLDVAKAFDKVWHSGLTFKMTQLGFPPYLTMLTHSFLRERKFQVHWLRTPSTSRPIMAGVPQGSCLSPTLFNIYTSDFPTLPSPAIAFSFADDFAALASSTKPHKAVKYAQAAINTVHPYYTKWRLGLNAEKTTATLFTKRRVIRNLPELQLHGQRIEWSRTNKYLGTTLDAKLLWADHIRIAHRSASAKLGKLYCLLSSPYVRLDTKLLLYKAVIRPTFAYAAQIWSACAPGHIGKLQVLQNKCLRISAFVPRGVRVSDLHKELNMETVNEFIQKLTMATYKKMAESANPLIRKLASIAVNPHDRYLRPIAALPSNVCRPRNKQRKPPRAKKRKANAGSL